MVLRAKFIRPLSHAGIEPQTDVEATLLEMLMTRSREYGEHPAFQFFEDDDCGLALGYQELDEAARRIAVGLRERFDPGVGVALVFPPGLDFIKAFFGCIYAGMLPIPATYPKPRRRSARLESIVSDARPAAILTSQRVLQTLGDVTSGSVLLGAVWVAIEDLEDSSLLAWEQPDLKPSDVAFLQYTSGSTKEPRGVAVSHANIAHNLEMIRQGFALSERGGQVGVSWLPAYHDMGLIGGLLETLYTGGTTVLMSPFSFLQRPARWLRAISDHRGVVSGGPNFAFELCLKKIKPAELEGVDLSCWEVAFTGAEPVRAATLRRFAERFSAWGFSESAFYPCYGLAEATLFVTGGCGPGKVTTGLFRADALQAQGEVVPAALPQGAADGASAGASQEHAGTVELVSCGGPFMGEEVVIVDPQTHRPCGEHQVGEIWIRGRNVAQGYHQRTGEDASPFGHLLAGDAGDGEGNFLRSGDLGFFWKGNLYVTGRRKSLLIIRGRNYYPHDLEATAQQAHDRLIPGGGAAFVLERAGDDPDLILVQEVDRSATEREREEMIAEIRRRVTAEHDLFVREVVLIRMGTLPRTTSGKVRYGEVKRQYAEGELAVVSQWSFAARGSTPSAAQPNEAEAVERIENAGSPLRNSFFTLGSDAATLTREIQERLMAWLVQQTGAANELGPDRPLAEYGVDSLSAMELICQLEQGLGLTKISPTILWSYPTPGLLAAHLAELVVTSRTEGDSQRLQVAGEGLAQDPLGGSIDAGSESINEDQFEQLLSQLEQMPEEEVSLLLGSEQEPEREQ